MRTTKRSGRTKRAAVAILIAVSVFFVRIDAVEVVPGRPRYSMTNSDSKE